MPEQTEFKGYADRKRDSKKLLADLQSMTRRGTVFTGEGVSQEESKSFFIALQKHKKAKVNN